MDVEMKPAGAVCRGRPPHERPAAFAEFTWADFGSAVRSRRKAEGRASIKTDYKVAASLDNARFNTFAPKSSSGLELFIIIIESTLNIDSAIVNKVGQASPLLCTEQAGKQFRSRIYCPLRPKNFTLKLRLVTHHANATITIAGPIVTLVHHIGSQKLELQAFKMPPTIHQRPRPFNASTMRQINSY
ncbi:hypothetical protein EVAR_88331_1 [Eumeta japonica]|uniref:Uncharacterized protein n=1 Tax=Eumeta variegata TaxID=151549 RepID=A0A4C1YDE3_EUMVA|nr:hypothetical protein EVAR_88331_1 [Eumeta japonica]